jgi:hypothetical protein
VKGQVNNREGRQLRGVLASQATVKTYSAYCANLAEKSRSIRVNERYGDVTSVDLPPPGRFLFNVPD